MTISTPSLPRRHFPTVNFDYQHLWHAVRRFRRPSNRLGVDLGTANTSIYRFGQGIVLQEPSVIAVDRSTDQAIAFGTAAKQLLGRTPPQVEVIYPIRHGVVCDLEYAVLMLKHFLQQASGGRRSQRLNITTGCANDTTGLEDFALIETLSAAGARQLSLIDQSVAAALGAGLDVDHPTGHLIVDIGGGTVEAAIVGLMKTIVSAKSTIAGQEMDQAIIKFLKSAHHLLIGELTAERIKIEFGSAFADSQRDQQVFDITGFDYTSGKCATVSVGRGDLREAMSHPLSLIVSTVKQVLEQTPPDLVSDIVERGIILTGGGALLPGLDQLISHETGIAVQVAPDPSNAVVLGTGYMLENALPASGLLSAR